MKGKGMSKKSEESNKPEARRRDWLELPDFWRVEMPDLFRVFDRLPASTERIRVEEEMKDDSIVIRAELPGMDPDNDVDITVSDGMLRIKAERRSETKEENDGRIRSEFRYGGASEADVKATYKDGILEVTVPVKTEAVERQRVAISRG
jgi:HSP20 family protein